MKSCNFLYTHDFTSIRFFFIKYRLLLIIIKFLLLNIIPCTRENKIIIINRYITIDPDLISDVDSINTNFASSNSILKIIIINFTIKLNCVSCSSRYVNILLQKKKRVYISKYQVSLEITESKNY